MSPGFGSVAPWSGHDATAILMSDPPEVEPAVADTSLTAVLFWEANVKEPVKLASFPLCKQLAVPPLQLSGSAIATPVV